MSDKTPSMSPSTVPLGEVLDRASGPRRAEVDELLALFEDVTGEKPIVWANRIVGFGLHEYRYDTGRTGTSPELAFAPGASHHTIYLVSDFAERWPDLLAALGKHRASKTCLYLTRLSAVDRDVLRELLERSLAETRSTSG